jgi:hypothetical protein
MLRTSSPGQAHNLFDAAMPMVMGLSAAKLLLDALAQSTGHARSERKRVPRRLMD